MIINKMTYLTILYSISLQKAIKDIVFRRLFALLKQLIFFKNN